MRTGGYTIQQTLTTETASVLKQSLTLARRRGHAQVTPLHVAATLLSSRTSLLRRACIKSHPGFSTNYQFAPHDQNHPLQCRALELCFNVALNRLPTIPVPLFHVQPSLANALVAALKRAQAHQRRGCIEQQQQQQTPMESQTQQTQVLAVKVELEQLVISILDDPSVSRVMREAGFNSTAVKNCVEDCSVSSVFYGGSVVGVFSSPNSPDQQHHNNINRFNHFQNPNLALWKKQFSNQSPDQNPLLVSYSHHHQRLREINLGLSLHTTSGHEARNMSNASAAKSFSGYSKAEEEETIRSVLSCCPECVSSFEREAKALKANQDKLPSWLQTHKDGENSSHKEELASLRRKWNMFCENLHQERTNNKTEQLSLMGKNYSYGLPYGSSNDSSRTISLTDSLGLKPNQRASNSVAKFRRQNSCIIEFDLGENEHEKRESIYEAEDNKEYDKITLDLGRSLFRSDCVTERRKKISALVKALEESVPCQTVTMRLIAESLIDFLSKKKDGWIMIEGSDTAAKRSIARTVSESVYGSVESLVHIKIKKGSQQKTSSEKLPAQGLENREKVVFLIENVDFADSCFLKLLSDRFEKNRRDKSGIDHRQAIFILTKDDSRYAKNRDSVLDITEQQSLGRKRKPESDLWVKEGKNYKAGEIEKGYWIKKEVSFNSSYLDLNVKAEEDGEMSPISSDITREEDTEVSSFDFLNRIQNRFVLNRSIERGIEKEMITRAFREVFTEEEELGLA